MIYDVKEKLNCNYNLIIQSLNDLFKEYNYREECLFFNELLSEKSTFPHTPNIETYWISQEIKRKIEIKFFINFFIRIDIVNTDNHDVIHINQYCKNKFKKDVGVYYMNEDTIEKKFIAYLNFMKEVILTDFSEVIAGEKWISIPFDWQGQK